ncbi:MAG: hypothetical protein KAU52_06720 [Methanosarcinales archaeon]|nr:hypothetical protein [Methanosarcinales archaeon]
MNSKRIAFGIGMALALLMVLATPATAEDPWIGWFVPQNSSAESSGEDTYVELWVTYDRSLQADQTYGALSYSLDIHFDPNCVNITSADYSTSPFGAHMFTPYAPGVVRIFDDNYGTMLPIDSGTYKMANLTFHATGSDCCCDIWTNFNYVSDEDGEPIANTYQNGTFTCGSVQTFTKPLPAGWNLISLPLTPTDSGVDTVLSGVTQNAVKQYNAVTKEFEAVSTMDPGVGYFVHVTESGGSTWSYQGAPVSSTNPGLKSGLNMIGVPNCTMSIDTAMGSADYRYVARWNAATQDYEVYNPVAPSAFHGFTEMAAGEGYFVSAKSDCALTISCLP